MYAINSTNTGWRAINSEADLLEGETLSLLEPVLPPTTPSPLEQIRALEAAKADATTKIIRQGLLLQTINLALARPDAAALIAGKTPEEARAAVIAVLCATDQGFKTMYELEQAIEPLRALL
jgi:hypothetical protein